MTTAIPLHTRSIGSFDVLLRLFVTNGNLWVTNTHSNVVQITSSGNGSRPKVLPDGRGIVFIRKSKNHAYLSVGGEEDYKGDEILADQICVVDISSRKERLLVADRMPGQGNVTEELEHTISHIHDDSLCFSPTGPTCTSSAPPGWYPGPCRS